MGHGCPGSSCTEAPLNSATPVTPAPSIDDILVENLAALWAVDAPLARRVDAIANQDILPTEPSRSGSPTIAQTLADGRRVYLHSRYQPADEAKKLIDPVPVTERLTYAVLGLGLGYHVKELLTRSSDEIVIWAFEPDLRMIRAALATVDVSEAILEKRLRLVNTLNKPELFNDWMTSLGGITMGFEIINHGPSVQCHEEYFQQAITLIDEFKGFGRTTINTLVINGKRTCENLARNVAWYVSAPGVGRLKGAYANKPAVIVSAGPSLRKNKHLLPALKGKVAMIAVQTSFRQLLEMGVEPDFVTSLDYNDISAQFFEKLPSDCKTELIADPKVASKVLGLNPGPTTLIGNEFIDKLLMEMNVGLTHLRAGATVAHLAFYLAEHLQCNPIIFVGQDLGFSDGMYYAPGTSYDDLWRPELSQFNTMEMMHWQRIVRERHILRKVPDYKGRPTYTEERLHTYLQQFERDFLKSDRTIIDSTEGGVAKRGTTIMTLAEALEKFCQPGDQFNVPLHTGNDWSRLGQAIQSLEKRLTETAAIERISRDTVPLLDEIKSNLDNQSKVNKLIGQIDLLRQEMTKYGRVYELMMQMSQQSELQRFAADKRIALAKADGLERQKRQLERDITNVRHVITAAETLQTLIKESIDICRQKQGEVR